MLIVSCGFCWISVQAACEQLMLIFLELDFCYAKFFVVVLLQGEDHAKERSCILGLSPLQMAACKLCPFNTMPAVSLLWYLSQP